MKKRYIQPEVEHINVIAMQRLMQGTGGGGMDPTNGQDDANDPWGNGAPYRY